MFFTTRSLLLRMSFALSIWSVLATTCMGPHGQEQLRPDRTPLSRGFNSDF